MADKNILDPKDAAKAIGRYRDEKAIQKERLAPVMAAPGWSDSGWLPPTAVRDDLGSRVIATYDNGKFRLSFVQVGIPDVVLASAEEVVKYVAEIERSIKPND